MPRTTISDVAKAAGVSIATASKALNNTGNISADTVRRVSEAAERLGYRPNRAAQLLAGKNKHIGILMPDEPASVYGLFRQGLDEAMAEYGEYGFRATLVQYARKNDREEFMPKLKALAASTNGLIFVGGYHIDEYIDEVRRITIPKVSMQVAVDESVSPSVVVDEEGEGRLAANFLSFCCKRAAMIVGDRRINLHRRNIESFTAEAASRGLVVTSVDDSFDEYDTARRLTERLLESDLPDGIYTSSYVAPAICAVLRERGMAGKIRVIGVDIFDDTAECLRDGSLSASIWQNQPLQARRAVELLISLMRGEHGVSVRIKPELVLASALAHYTNYQAT
ncbi:MAG: LacI family DNA-binding transcriptional regulator [Clostridia bacterium]|nr:LacI family DNA-binding transcriptional regulator [Clostridia bacterium]